MTEPSVLSRLARLAREVEIDAAALAARADETAQLIAAPSLARAELVLLAVNLHGYYTALEALLERVARLMDDASPSGASWHAELLEQMRVAVPPARTHPSARVSVHRGLSRPCGGASGRAVARDGDA
jgi:hypothetical protein